jgi:hypothetical protein
MKSFITGSCVYGTPTAESDIDLVLTLSSEDIELLSRFADNGKVSAGADGGSLRFGNLNLICISEVEMEAWKSATDDLVARKPVTRNEAITLIKERVKERRKNLAAAN